MTFRLEICNHPGKLLSLLLASETGRGKRREESSVVVVVVAVVVVIGGGGGGGGSCCLLYWFSLFGFGFTSARDTIGAL